LLAKYGAAAAVFRPAIRCGAAPPEDRQSDQHVACRPHPRIAELSIDPLARAKRITATKQVDGYAPTLGGNDRMARMTNDP
jgi:hypothetical protein